MDQKPGFLLRLIGSIEITMRYSWLAYNLYIIYSFPVSIGIGGFLNRMPPKVFNWKFWKAFCKRELIPDLLFEGSDNAKKHMEAIRFNDQIEEIPHNIFGTCQTTLLCLGRAPLKNATISLNCRDMLPESTQSITPYSTSPVYLSASEQDTLASNLRARRSLSFSVFIRSM